MKTVIQHTLHEGWPTTKTSRLPRLSFFTNTSRFPPAFSTHLHTLPWPDFRLWTHRSGSWNTECVSIQSIMGTSPLHVFWSNSFAADLPYTSTAHLIIVAYHHPSYTHSRKLYTRKQTVHKAKGRQWERKKRQSNDYWASLQTDCAIWPNYLYPSFWYAISQF